ncbi:TadE/TadG family type IV pilus assembly protein [Streptomyces halobius]|uniref:Pilus assembly protein n=1 Tax=Streptomyces halobius TaxID=2879846 RepID=A0ABY4M6L2_9ACTN|nr:TadE/TadG family type IV pilus assembly protein [Streptomyces halobius]UQA93360.1 pilus assembly protein [Streptomyces halobius]
MTVPTTTARGGSPSGCLARLFHPLSRPHGRRVPARLRGRGRDRGQASIEFLGFLPILLIVALAVVQLGLGAYAVQQAGTGARAAARTASMDEADRTADPQTAGRAAMSGWLADDATISVTGGGGSVHATATVRIPSLIPGVDFGSARRGATMPRPANALDGGPRTYEGAPGVSAQGTQGTRTAPGAPGVPAQGPPR